MTAHDRKEWTDLTKGFIPVTVAIVFLLAAFQIGVTYSSITSSGSTTQTQIDEIKQGLNKIAETVDNLQRSIREVPSDVIRKSDMLRFCLHLERNNKGFSCPDVWTN